MFEFLKKLFASSPKVDLGELIKHGAIIVDVRSKGEFQGGHLKGSVNIPLQNLRESFSKLRKDKPIITCCASGARSASAKSILKSNGYTDVHNGGPWTKLRRYKN